MQLLKKILFPFLIFVLTSAISLAQAPILSADVVQPVYENTSKPYLTIIAGSGKTSYVSAVLNDPTDPAATEGIFFTVTGTNPTLTGTSSNTAVVSNGNIIVTLQAGKYLVKVIPSGAGYATISLKATNTFGTSSTYTLKYAASPASLNPANTVYHTSASDASGISAVDSNYMFVADDENNFIRLYNRFESGKELYSLDITSAAGATADCDLESSSSSVLFNPGKRLYWAGSMGNSKNGDIKPDYNKVIATDMTGIGAAGVLTVKSYSNQLRPGLISWGDANGWNFTAGAASGMIPKRIDGFNIEGLTVTHGGDTVYVGFRAPCVPVKGFVPTASNRKYSVVAPVNNFETMMNGNGEVTAIPVMGEPILFDLEGLGIRSIEKVGSDKYLIVAGSYKGGGRPAVYLWDGVVPTNSGKNPVSISSPVSKLIKLNLNGLQDIILLDPTGSLEGFPEAMIADISGSLLNITLVSDDGPVDFYNDGNQAKDLPHNEFKKFRDDKFIISTDSIYGPIINICPGITSTSFSSNLSGSNYIWQWDTCGTGNCYTNIADDIHFTGTNTKNLQVNNMATSWNGYKFHCVTDGNNSNEYTLKYSVNWTGAIDNNWETASNWDCNHLPDESTDVFIKTGSPVLHSNTAIRSLEMSSGANLTIIQGNNLTVRH